MRGLLPIREEVTRKMLRGVSGFGVGRQRRQLWRIRGTLEDEHSDIKKLVITRNALSR